MVDEGHILTMRLSLVKSDLSIAIAGLYFNLTQSARHGHRFDLRKHLTIYHLRYYQEVCSQYNEGYTDIEVQILSYTVGSTIKAFHAFCRIDEANMSRSVRLYFLLFLSTQIDNSMCTHWPPFAFLCSRLIEDFESSSSFLFTLIWFQSTTYMRTFPPVRFFPI